MEQERRARSSTPPASSVAPCPACDKPVDSLRAGQVAILDGKFRYFCDADCKLSYVDVTSRRPALDAMTADPPAVSAARSAEPPAVASGVRSGERVLATAAADEASNEASAPYFPHHGSREAFEDGLPSGIREQGGDSGDLAEHEELADAAEGEDAPSTLRSSATELTPDRASAEDLGEASDEPISAAAARLAPAAARRSEAAQPGAYPEELDEAEPKESAERGAGSAADGFQPVSAQLAALAPVLGVFAGVLAAVVSLAGEPAAVVRLPLALIAAAIVLTRIALGRREPSTASPWVLAAPLGAASIFAVVSTALHDPRAEAHATFVGLAAASALAVDLLLARACRDVVLARTRTTSALAVTARVVRGEGSQDVVLVDAALVKPGEQVVVEAGEIVAVDGIVAAGEAEVAPWLDSPSLADKTEGDAVVAGALVVSGRLRINTTFSGSERAWLRLMLATTSRIDVAAPLVAFVRRAVERGAPLAALLVAGAVYADNGRWLDVAIAACAGGYVLAAAAAVSAAALAHARGHVTAQRRGIVYKDAIAFDAAARADVAVLCSRGTILLGAPEIVGVEAVTKDGVDAPPKAGGAPLRVDTDRILSVAAGAELSSTHPFAAAVLREARARGVRPENMRSALGHSGLGVTALSPSGDRVIVGSRSFLLQEKVSVAIADARTSELEAEGRSVLLVAVGGRLIGLLALQDGLRPGARAAVQRMHDARIEPVLLSGEARETSETIARALDIEHVRPEILPADRGAEVRALGDGGHLVAALGHASTDDGALGAADVSIAMEAAGAAPGEWGVALASDDVRDAALALTVPRGCRDRARTALIVGGLTQALGACGIAFGIVPPAVAPLLGVVAAAAAVSIVKDPS